MKNRRRKVTGYDVYPVSGGGAEVKFSSEENFGVEFRVPEKFLFTKFSSNENFTLKSVVFWRKIGI